VNAKPASSSGSCVVYRCGMHIPDNKEPSRSRSVPITTPNAPPLTGICDRFEIATESTGWSWFGAWKKNPNADAKLDEITNSALEYAAEKQTKKVVDEISSRGESAVPTNLNENGLKTLRDALTAEGKSAWLSSTRTNTNAGIAEVKKQLNAIADGVKDSASPPTNIKKYGDDPTTGILFVSEELANRLKNNEGYRCNDAGDGTWTCIPPAQNARTLTPPPDPRKAEQERIRQLEEQLRAANARQQQQQTFGNPSGAGSGSGGLGSLGQMLKGITGGGQPAAGNGVPQPAGTCSPSFICGGNTLYSRNNQCVDQAVQQCPYGCSGNQCAQTPSQCQPAPTQPNPANCQNGTWKPTYGGQNNACVVGWQCVPGGGGDAGAPVAQLSCQPKVADAGMTLSLTWSCSAGVSTGAGFSTEGALSGATTTVVSSPPGNTNTATYGLTCSNEGRTGSAQCSVQVAKPGIVLIANPKQVASGKTSALGWVTASMQSCVISSPDLPEFTSQNANNTSVNGTALTPPLTAVNAATTTYGFLLHCITLGGGARDATTTVMATP